MKRCLFALIACIAVTNLLSSANPAVENLPAQGFGSLSHEGGESAAHPPDSFSFGKLGAEVDKRGTGASTITQTTGGALLVALLQDLKAEATSEGLWVTSTTDVEIRDPDRLRVKAAAVGRSSRSGKTLANLRIPSEGSVRIEEDVVKLTLGGLTEEYRVSTDGVRQDFIVLQRPSGVDGALVVDLELTGAQAEAKAYGALLTFGSTGRELAYNQLFVTDDSGRKLSARLEVPSPHRMRFVVEDDGAIYPVRIDPTFSDADWISLNPGMPGASGEIFALAVDSAGNLYAGGRFTYMGTLTANNIAKWSGNVWSTLSTGMNDRVDALAIIGDDLYAGGNFTTAGGLAANRVAKWNGSNWSALGSGTNGRIESMAVGGSNLYVGGAFTTAGGNTVNNVAKWNGNAWSGLGSGVNGYVYALVANGSELYAGGFFTSAGGTGANRIAKWNGSSWSALGSGLNDDVYALVSNGNELYAGGDFTTAGGNPASRIAKWNGSTWTALGSGVNGQVYALALSGSDLYVGGGFPGTGGPSPKFLAKWNGSTWSALGTGTNDTVFALAISGNDLYVGGWFVRAGNTGARNVAKWSGDSWQPLGSGLNESVLALEVIDTDLFVGGYFLNAGGSGADFLAKWDGNSWSKLGSGVNGIVYSLAVIESDLYAGGSFTSAGGVGTNYIAKWSGNAWSTLGSGLSGSVQNMAVIASDLYVGGYFESAGGAPANRIAKWNGSAWSTLGSGMNDDVLALATNGSDLFAGGNFTTAGGTTVNRIAKWNGSTWAALGTGMDDRVRALATIEGDVYVGGDFTMVDGMTINYIARWDGNSWSQLGTGTNGRIEALSVAGNDLYAGGWFSTANGINVNHIAKWNGSTWSALGSGVDAPVRVLRSDLFGHLFVGGQFLTAGGVFTPFLAQANLDGVPTVATSAASSVTETSAYLGGQVSDDGGEAVTSRGIILDTSPVSTGSLANSVQASQAGAGVFSVFISALAEGTTYFARAFATNIAGTSFGDEVVFTTRTQVAFTDWVSAFDRSILPGTSQNFSFSLEVPRIVAISTTGSAALRAVLRDGIGTLIFNFDGDANLNGKIPLPPGNFSLEITRLPDGGAAQEYHLNIDASELASSRPDLSVGSTAAASGGRLTYLPSSQTATLTSKKARPISGYARAANRGNLPDVLSLRGTRGNSFFAVNYFGAGGNVTAQMLAGSLKTPELDLNDDDVPFRISVVPNKRKLVRKTKKGTNILNKILVIPLSATSTAEPNLRDAAAIKVQVR